MVVSSRRGDPLLWFCPPWASRAFLFLIQIWILLNIKAVPNLGLARFGFPHLGQMRALVHRRASLASVSLVGRIQPPASRDISCIGRLHSDSRRCMIRPYRAIQTI